MVRFLQYLWRIYNNSFVIGSDSRIIFILSDSLEKKPQRFTSLSNCDESIPGIF